MLFTVIIVIFLFGPVGAPRLPILAFVLTGKCKYIILKITVVIIVVILFYPDGCLGFPDQPEIFDPEVPTQKLCLFGLIR